MMSRKKLVVGVVLACAAIGIATAATASADRHGNQHGFPSRYDPITGFPNKINEFNLNGYEIVTSYPLGVNAGNTFQQDYTDTGVTAFATAGPDLGGPDFVRTYTAMPIGHDELFVTWFLPDGSTPDVFVMNFKTGIVSDVAPPGSQLSLGTVKIIK